jgi:hypothetical protein
MWFLGLAPYPDFLVIDHAVSLESRRAKALGVGLPPFHAAEGTDELLITQSKTHEETKEQPPETADLHGAPLSCCWLAGVAPGCIGIAIIQQTEWIYFCIDTLMTLYEVPDIAR